MSPQRRHWPLYDTATKAYIDATNYKKVYNTTTKAYEDAPSDDRESLIDLEGPLAWSLAPVSVFMDLRPERGKKTMARTYNLKKWGLSRVEWRRVSVASSVGRSPRAQAAYVWLWYIVRNFSSKFF